MIFIEFIKKIFTMSFPIPKYKKVKKVILTFSTPSITVPCIRYATVDNTPMNPSFFGKNFLLILREVFELQISPIPIFASSFQEISDGQIKFSLQPTQQLTLDKR